MKTFLIVLGVIALVVIGGITMCTVGVLKTKGELEPLVDAYLVAADKGDTEAMEKATHADLWDKNKSGLDLVALFGRIKATYGAYKGRDKTEFTGISIKDGVTGGELKVVSNYERGKMRYETKWHKVDDDWILVGFKSEAVGEPSAPTADGGAPSAPGEVPPKGK